MTLDEALVYDAGPSGDLACEHWCSAVSLDCPFECDCRMERARAVVAVLQAGIANLRSWWCPARKHRRTTSGRMRDTACRECAIEARQAACGHSRGATFAHYAGILGARYSCPDCGASMPEPEETP